MLFVSSVSRDVLSVKEAKEGRFQLRIISAFLPRKGCFFKRSVLYLPRDKAVLYFWRTVLKEVIKNDSNEAGEEFYRRGYFTPYR